MIHLSLSVRGCDQQVLELPLEVKDILQSPMPYYLVYGKAAIAFETENPELNERLGLCMPEAIDGGVKELSLLAHLLGHMDEQRLELLSNNLPDAPCQCGELVRRASYYCNHYLTKEGAPDAACLPLEQYTMTWERSNLEERLDHEFRSKLEKQRMTGGELFEKIVERARNNGDMKGFDEICDYVLPEDHEKGKLCSYQFDMVPVVNFGNSEGIYVDCSLRGKFDESERKHIGIGTLKTLSTDLDACKVMGELCGVLMYHEDKYVSEYLYLFDSTESIERIITSKLNVEQAQAENMTMSGQQMC